MMTRACWSVVDENLANSVWRQNLNSNLCTHWTMQLCALCALLRKVVLKNANRVKKMNNDQHRLSNCYTAIQIYPWSFHECYFTIFVLQIVLSNVSSVDFTSLHFAKIMFSINKIHCYKFGHLNGILDWYSGTCLSGIHWMHHPCPY